MILPDAVKDSLESDLVRHHLDRMLERGLAALPGEPALAGPKELHIELTHRCNLKCVMCEHWEIERVDPASVKREMDLAGIRAMVSRSESLRGISNIAITGGEPWLRSDFTDIVVLLAEKFPAADIIVLSNFWNTGHIRLKMKEFAARGVARLRLGSSLDGLEETHDRVRGQAGSFSGIVNTVRMLKEEFPGTPFGFTFTMTPYNVGELFAVHRLVTEEFGCSLGAQWAIDRPGVPPLPWTAEAREEGLAQVRRVLADLCRRHGAARKLCSPDKDKHDWLWSELLYWRYLEEYGREARRFPFFKRCTAGERHVMVDPEGGVFFCPVNRDRLIGSVREASIDAIWSSPKAAKEREYIDSCRCHCWLRCTSTPALDRLVRLSK